MLGAERSANPIPRRGTANVPLVSTFPGTAKLFTGPETTKPSNFTHLPKFECPVSPFSGDARRLHFLSPCRFAQPAGQFIDRKRLAHEVTLGSVATHLCKPVQDFLSSDPLRYDLQGACREDSVPKG